jgi:hypothetical protein
MQRKKSTALFAKEMRFSNQTPSESASSVRSRELPETIVG